MGPSFDFDRRMTRNFGEPGAKVNDGVFRAFGESASLLPEPPLQFARRHTYMVSSSANEVQGTIAEGGRGFRGYGKEEEWATDEHG